MLLLNHSDIIAVLADPHPIDYTQPDGSNVTYLLKGDEHFKYKTTMDGYVIDKDEKGYFNYATIDSNGRRTRTNIKVNNDNRRTKAEIQFLSKAPTSATVNSLRKSRIAQKVSSSATPIQKSYPVEGTPRSIVILVNFSDLTFVTPNPKQAFNNLLNLHGYAANGGTGSATDYFNDNSMGVFKPQFDVVGPYTLSNKMAFYGTNDADDNDQNPQQMILEACHLASKDGVDFSIYDTDKDGTIDNIFVYYAGFNEAEGAPAESIWPHRWAVQGDSLFNGVKAYGYACTSELRSSTGATMCGIGTFCHEFGHVLGLPDYYATDGGTHHTMSFWSVMDAGPYLNQGKTPPAYSAWDRFYLGWTTPMEIQDVKKYTLDTLTSSNKCYILYKSEDKSKKQLTEFFTLENRQKKGWDKYLPGHGMLITQINYDQSDWNSNTVNNDKNVMDVDLIEADGQADNRTLPGDSYPGSENVITFTPKFRNPTSDKLWISNIKEMGGKITFDYVKTDTSLKKLSISSTSDGYLQILLPSMKGAVEIYDITGKNILFDANPTSNPYYIGSLERNKFYIIKFNDYTGTVFINE